MHSIATTPKRLLIASAITLLIFGVTGCEKQVKKTAVSISSTAYYTVYQEKINGPWENRLTSYANTGYAPKAISFTVPDPKSPFSIAFACPSVNGVKPHEVYIFYATPAEMDVVNFTCKRSTQDIVQRPLYGKIEGISISSLLDPLGEQAHIAFSRDTAIDGWEAYAARVRAGARDVIAYKGAQQPGVLTEPEKLYIKRSVALGITEEPQRIDIDFTGKDISAYVANFDPAKRSTVIINGVNEGEQVESTVGFLSDNKSYLALAKSNASNFTFLPVPLDLYTGGISGFTNKNEFNPKEGHELIVVANDPTGQPLRRAYKFFTLSNASTHNVALPAAITATPVVKLRGSQETQDLILNWSAFNDPAAGVTRIYRWVFNADAAAADPKNIPTVNSGETSWIVHVTPGWLEAADQTPANFSFIIPSKLDTYVSDGKGGKAYTWHQEWSIKAASDVQWEYAAIVVNQQFFAKDVVDYYLNRDFQILREDSLGIYSANDFVFGESFVRATATP